MPLSRRYDSMTLGQYTSMTLGQYTTEEKANEIERI
jgi:hypothetical protein